MTIPVRVLTITTYVPVPAKVMSTNGQNRKGLRPGVGLGPTA